MKKIGLYLILAAIAGFCLLNKETNSNNASGEISVLPRPQFLNEVSTVADGDTLDISFNKYADGTACCRIWANPGQWMEIHKDGDFLARMEPGEYATLTIGSYTIRVYDWNTNALVSTAYLCNTLESPSLMAPPQTVSHRPHRPKVSTASM